MFRYHVFFFGSPYYGTGSKRLSSGSKLHYTWPSFLISRIMSLLRKEYSQSQQCVFPFYANAAQHEFWISFFVQALTRCNKKRKEEISSFSERRRSIDKNVCDTRKRSTFPRHSQISRESNKDISCRDITSQKVGNLSPCYSIF